MKVLYFTGPWCQACQQLKPFVERETTNHGVTLEYIDMGEQPDVADAHGVRGIPAISIVDDADKQVDLITAAQIRIRLPAALKEAAAARAHAEALIALTKREASHD
ncbi:thioredoxin family protein [Camelimonas abortus]|uniref:Thioredoxin family protein n=1 Tax=Camelimonas abortus TaxID=1017184 RepID=A0ABV7LHH6_9HYPH